MALNVDQVSVTLDTVGQHGSRGSAPPQTPEQLREQLRPIVLEILESELDRLRREMG
jgi:hypothetical protein